MTAPMAFIEWTIIDLYPQMYQVKIAKAIVENMLRTA